MKPRTVPAVLRSKGVINARDIQGVEIPRSIENHAGAGVYPVYESASYKGEG